MCFKVSLHSYATAIIDNVIHEILLIVLRFKNAELF